MSNFVIRETHWIITEEYVAWAKVAEELWGNPWPIKQLDLGSCTSGEILVALERLKTEVRSRLNFVSIPPMRTNAR